MRHEKLSELLDISIGRTPSRNESKYWGEGHKWVSIRDLNSKIITETKEQITDLAIKEVRCKMAPQGTLLFSFKLTIGKMAFAGCDLFTNEAIAAFSIKDKTKLNSEFLYYALLSAKFGGSNQAAMGKTLNSKSLAEIEIPLPPLDDQIRIAHLLGKVEALIAQRKQNLQQIDDLLKSVFLEMFGDPARNEKGWATKEITEVCDEIVDCVNKTAPKVEEQTPFVMVRTSNIRRGKISLDNIKYVDAETYKIWTRRSKPRRGDILFTREAPMGEAGLIDFEDQIFLGQRIMQYRCNLNAANPKFILELMKTRFFQRQVEKLGKGSTVKHLAVPDCLKFIVIMPPISVQNRFADIVEKVDGIKSRYQQSLSGLESLYGALSQQAVRGELDLSRISLGENTLPTAARAPLVSLQHSTNIEVRTGGTIPFNSWTFRDFLSARKGKVLTAETLWHELQQGDFENLPPTFESVQSLILNELEKGDLLEQVYDRETIGVGRKSSEKKIALRVRDAS